MGNIQAKIDLQKYRQNLQDLRKRLASETRFLAVVKANAYGHGAVRLARVCQEEKVDYLAVARLAEAVELRSFGITLPILLLAEPLGEDLSNLIGLDLTYTVYSWEFAVLLQQLAASKQLKTKVHIKVDTGMHRLGIAYQEATDFGQKVAGLANLQIEGIYTHFAEAELVYTEEQCQRFCWVVEQLQAQQITIPIKHLANSFAAQNFPKTHFNMVRFGLATYKDILTWQSQVCQVKYLPAGAPISYNRTYRLPTAAHIAVVGAGYADGVSLRLSNQGRVLIKEQAYPIVGRVCMDLLMVNLGENPQQIQAGDAAVLLGQQGVAKIDMQEICALTGQIPYEVTCGISQRVERVYK